MEAPPAPPALRRDRSLSEKEENGRVAAARFVLCVAVAMPAEEAEHIGRRRCRGPSRSISARASIDGCKTPDRAACIDRQEDLVHGTVVLMSRDLMVAF